MTMTDNTHDTFVDLAAGTPMVFVLAARSLPVLLMAQFLLAGQALFAGMGWGAHFAVGAITLLPVAALAGYAAFVTRLRGFGWWAGIVFVLYVTQVALAAAGTTALGFHPFNAALMLAASLILLFKVERRKNRHDRTV